MSHRISLIGSEIIKKANVVAGVALLDNAFDDTFKVVVLPAEQIPEAEPKLLEEAKAATGRIRFPSCDILMVQKIGKNYSGSGADPNIVGRCGNPKLKVDSDKESLHTGIATALGIDPLRPRIVIVKNSLEVQCILASESMIPEAEQIPGMRIEGEPFELEFDEEGNLLVEY